jgi:hypothetical protein
MDLGLAGLINNISLISPSGHNSLIGFMGLDLVCLIGLGRVSLIGRISLVGQISLVRFISHIIGHNCLDGVIGIGLVSLVDLVNLSGINDLVGLDSLVAAIIAAAEFLVVMATQAAAAKHMELRSNWQALPKLPMQQFGIIALHYWYYSH